MATNLSMTTLPRAPHREQQNANLFWGENQWRQKHHGRQGRTSTPVYLLLAFCGGFRRWVL
jgi:hypothetical protein